MASFVRKSKFRHIFGEVAKRENMYEDIKGTGTSLDTNMIKVNNKYISYIREGSGGGALCVFPITQVGRQPVAPPLISGHTRPVTDMDFSPFNPNVIATTCEDCTVRVWKIPEEGMPQEGIREPEAAMTGHGRKSTELLWHPSASGILASSGADAVVKIWDVEQKQTCFSIEGQHNDMIQSFQWNQEGSLIGTQCRDKKIRVFDVRSQAKVQEIQSHQGVKTARMLFDNKRNWIISTGFGLGSNRQVLIWDLRSPEKPIVSNVIDQASGVMAPFLDEATQVLFIAGKGETNIRYYELTDDVPHFFYIATCAEGTPTRGITPLPKQYVHAQGCEIMKFYRITAKDTIEPVSFIVPRRSEMFQSDIYPPIVDSTTPSMTAEEWKQGENKPQRCFIFTADGHPEYADADALPTSSPSFSPSPSPSPVSSPSTLRSVPEGYVPKEELDEANATIADLEKQIADLEEKISSLAAAEQKSETSEEKAETPAQDDTQTEQPLPGEQSAVNDSSAAEVTPDTPAEMAQDEQEVSTVEQTQPTSDIPTAESETEDTSKPLEDSESPETIETVEAAAVPE